MVKKRLYLDIEVTPNVGFFWNPGHKISVSYDNIIEERKIICICYQWEGKKVESLKWTNKKCDKEMVAAIVKVMDEADEIIGHNLDRFDLPWIRTRAFYHRVPMRHNYTTTDTLKLVRRYLRLNSNRLDYVSKYSGSEGKIHTDFGMWKRITLTNDQDALSKMIRYCKGDIVELRKVFTELLPYMPHKTHYGVIRGGEKEDCPEGCQKGVTKVRRHVSAHGGVRQQYRCNGCGKHYTKAGK